MHEMRKKERRLQDEETRALLHNGEYGVLATIGQDGQPYGVPMSYAFAEDHIWLHSAQAGHKVANLTHCDRVSFCVVGKTEPLPAAFSMRYRSAMVFGAVRLCSGEEKMIGLMHLVRRYAPDFLEQGRRYAESALRKTNVYCLDIECMSGKTNRY